MAITKAERKAGPEQNKEKEVIMPKANLKAVEPKQKDTEDNSSNFSYLAKCESETEEIFTRAREINEYLTRDNVALEDKLYSCIDDARQRLLLALAILNNDDVFRLEAPELPAIVDVVNEAYNALASASRLYHRAK